ncbi:MAG: hypothetical protein AB7U38_05090 [Hyphomicrobiales bacterium]
MDMQHVHQYARKLIQSHGSKAEVEAANRQQEAERTGDRRDAETWRRIRASVRELRPARQG